MPFQETIVRKALLAVVVFLFAVAAATPAAFARTPEARKAQDGPIQPKVEHNPQRAWPDEPLVTAQHGMVVSSQHLATQIGVDVLKKGGNAIDAAVAIR